MPWKEGRVLDQRLQFLSSYQKEEMSVADLRRAYRISRPTAYRWINRYNETGPEGLVDRSRRPHTCACTNQNRQWGALLREQDKRQELLRKLGRPSGVGPAPDLSVESTVRHFTPKE
jgi:transposase|nr:helix-turn-helix domain-containing protein [Edaphobacter aggregans]